MGSVKDLEVIIKPTKDKMGLGRFHFSDKYSVFDWGEMPDLIENKGSVLCMMGAYFFERLEEKGIRTHYRGVIQAGKLVQIDELKVPTSTMEISLVRVFHPKAHRLDGKLTYDYDVFSPNLANFLIPLEIIYRNGLPKGSSVFERLNAGLKPEDLGLNHPPQPGDRLKKPIFDVSTKLEERDRYVTWVEAQELAGLSDGEVREVKNILLHIDELITETASKAGLENEDGKVEFGFDPHRKPMVVDVVGTLDECRFTYEGIHVSKEIARQYYRETNWYKDVEKAKKEASIKGIKEWKVLCESKPPRLDPNLRKVISEIYMASANEFTEFHLFEVPRLAEILDSLA
ncbi:MAG: phosphoribosylaminoimidazolesuccinocarboxamide synthase [Methanocellales archaeon]|nr:phosphoribosylaminoimidazolesuccinocarboxamide synthase [Methanocellales archaeon]MDD5446314.1 phosphoribosylaminoimidazolesuccinocarboxamide synthase [Methanocellales archaeon]